MNADKLPRLYMRLILILALIVASGLVLWQNSRPPSGSPAGTAWHSPIPLGLDLRGGTELRYRIRVERLSEFDKKDVVQRTIDVIEKRIDPEGRLEIDVRPAGEFRFYIQLPGMGPEESRRIEDLIRRAGQLRFHLVNDDPSDRQTARRGEVVPNCTPFLPQYGKAGEVARWKRGTYQELADLPETETRWYLVENGSRVGGQDMANPRPTTDQNGLPAVGFSFKGKGRIEFEQLTEENKAQGDKPGRKLAIILDEDLYSAPEIQSRISGDGIITGRFTVQEVNDLVAVLRAGQLPADIELEWNNTVGAQLGEDSIRAGIRASLVAAILVVAFMAAYYFLTGMIANFAVVINILFVLVAMSAMQSVLTLPGIAGLVLTLGMAVDANVLINERIREEMERGKGLRLAIRAGYDRAFVTIVDSNLTTLIAGLILFGVGTGPVRGFAVTLSLGIITSVCTSIWVTRWILETMVEKGWVNSLHMMRLLTKPNIRFSQARYLCMGLSALCIAAGLVVFFSRGKGILDSDLTGGFRAEMEVSKAIPISEFRARISKLFGKSDVQSVWNAGESGSDRPATRFSIRIQELTEKQQMEKIQHDLAEMLRADGDAGAVQHVDETWQYDLTLSKPRTEEALLALLAGERYTEASISNLVLEGKEATEFVLKPSSIALDAKQPDAEIAKVVEALNPWIVRKSILVTIGDIQTEQGGVAQKDAIARGSVTFKLGEAAGASAVREAIIKEMLQGARPDDLRVSGSGADAGAEIAREMVVRAKVSDLERIKGYTRKELPVWTFSMPASDAVSVSLQSPMSETELLGRLDEGAVKVRNLVHSAIPVGVEGNHFVLTANGLSEDKSAEKIREQLEAEFAPELQTQAGGKALVVTATPSDPPAFVDNGAQQVAQGFQFFKLDLSAPVQLQFIHERLVKARLADALLVQGDINNSKVASQQVSAAWLRLKGSPQQNEADLLRAREAIQTREAFRSIEAIGARVASEMKNKAMLAIVLSWFAMIVYLWIRFGEVKFGLGAVIALVHDVLFTLGAVGVADALSTTALGSFLGFSDIKVNVTMIAAFLTLIGYSVNDTIVIFDRIRENMGGVKRRLDADLVDTSVNQTLSRTILTSFTVFLVLVVLYLMGGSVIHGFAFVMLFGVFVGTYSSVFIAAPVLIGWENGMARLRKLFRIVTFRF